MPECHGVSECQCVIVCHFILGYNQNMSITEQGTNELVDVDDGVRNQWR